jgi:ABC-2 type transport system permease protein
VAAQRQPNRDPGRLTMRVRTQLGVMLLLARMFARSELEYRGAYIIDRIATVASYGSAFAAIFLLLARFSTLGGWSWPELAFLLSFQLLSYAMGASTSFTQFRDMEETIRLGTFDVLLVKPFSPWAYIVFSGLNIGYLGHVVLGIGLIGWAVTQVPVDWTLARIAFLLLSFVSAAMVVAALMTMIGASAMILVRARHLFTIFFGFWELARYPITIFPAALQVMLLFVVPLGFMGFVPVAVLLDKPVPFLGPVWGGVAALAVGPLLVFLAARYWRYAISHYQGGGG